MPDPTTLRLTFKVTKGAIQLVAHERLSMICPPSVGERPRPGVSGGYWLELRDALGNVLFHRVLVAPLGDSVEVHSPDGAIERVFGDSDEGIFEALIPYDDEAASVAFMGESLQPQALRSGFIAGASRELAKFSLSPSP
ncbi:MAG: hypothetical protein KBA31_20670 [Alphaproteobacteria bacterium]|nr:hypothetical protein [Alphaproteobacteria bacterium]